MITEKQLKEIVKLSESVPEEYRQKCFELLLGHTLQSYSPRTPVKKPAPDEIPQESTSLGEQFVLPIDVKAFLSQYGLDESLLWRFFLIEGSEIRHIYKLKATKKTKAQIQHALMMSLESAITTGQFEVGIEDLRARCKDQKCYDSSNFMKTIKTTYCHLFKGVQDVETVVLSPGGKSELADLLEELSGADG
jgi:hypothetical protein